MHKVKCNKFHRHQHKKNGGWWVVKVVVVVQRFRVNGLIIGRERERGGLLCSRMQDRGSRLSSLIIINM